MYLVVCRTWMGEIEFVEDILGGGVVTCITTFRDKAKRYTKEAAEEVIELAKNLFNEEWEMEKVEEE